MKNVKMPTSRSYQEYLISSLQKDRERCAAYIQAVLEEKDPEHELLLLVIKDVIDARMQTNSLSESAKLKWKNLEKMITESGGSEIYTFVELLDNLGFVVAIRDRVDEAIDPKEIIP